MLAKFQHSLYWPHDPADEFVFQGLLTHIPGEKTRQKLLDTGWNWYNRICYGQDLQCFGRSVPAKRGDILLNYQPTMIYIDQTQHNMLSIKRRVEVLLNVTECDETKDSVSDSSYCSNVAIGGNLNKSDFSYTGYFCRFWSLLLEILQLGTYLTDRVVSQKKTGVSGENLMRLPKKNCEHSSLKTQRWNYNQITLTVYCRN